MDYYCSKCDYKSPRKQNVKRHINGPRSKCSDAIITDKIKNNCKFCGKEFILEKNLKKHIKMCGDTIIKEVKELKNQIKELQQKPIIQNIIILNGFNQTSYCHLTERHFKQAISKMIYSVPQLIKDVHFDPQVPENHNIFISNIQGRYAMVYDGEKWCSKPQEQIIDELIINQEYAIEEWLGKGDKYPEEMKKFNEYLEKKEEEDELKTIIREEVKLVLYNNRSKIKNS